ncbi:DNA polymerase-3 subunit epsilon [Pseudoduganella flava]|uniref:DNA-directed DNA polymerase n=1 Tax=Pseudoduganella flava TaxID=871742 RepID=A0A562PPX0_9BURK|nr:3'-5' exonuclease [Pseudoduganella flava]QGZ37703.1 3'-5' exonuclease [Pseudoduganella flava]TWI46501.1 DNA polymerase-3 subunit epsilon [Pseudoduganella flava]
MLTKPIVMLDFETTGLSPAMGDRITEVAALRIADGVIVDRYVSLVNCGVRIPSFITSLTGITQKMVDTAPPAHEVVPRLLAFIGGDPLAAHNASFDEKFLHAESGRLGMASGHTGTVCSLKLCRRVFPDFGSYKLGQLGNRLGIAFQGTAHRAEADAQVAAEVLLHVGRHIANQYGIASVDPALLMSVNKLAAAKVPAFLHKRSADTGAH